MVGKFIREDTDFYVFLTFPCIIMCLIIQTGGERMKIPVVNLQALASLAFFVAALFIARIVANIYRGKWPGAFWMVLYLRTLLGFLLAGAAILGYYSFAGVDVISRYLP
jgi:hypothetical protein